MLSGAKSLFFDRIVAIFSQKYGSFIPNSLERISFCQNPFSAVLRLKKGSKKKVLIATELKERGGIVCISLYP